jgi:putative endonuclease
MKQYFVYIMASKSKVLYTGVTNHLLRRVYEHKQLAVPGFTQKYRTTRLVYFENTSEINSAIEREKQIKGWLRARKVALIKSFNPKWEDLSVDWYEPDAFPAPKPAKQTRDSSLARAEPKARPGLRSE